MVHYTKQNYEELLKILNGPNEEASGQINTHLVILSVNGRLISMNKHELVTLIFDKKISNNRGTSILNLFIAQPIRYSNTKRYVDSRSLSNALIKFLRKVPLIKVPLYINSFPELSKWRMSIGK